MKSLRSSSIFHVDAPAGIVRSRGEACKVQGAGSSEAPPKASLQQVVESWFEDEICARASRRPGVSVSNGPEVEAPKRLEPTRYEAPLLQGVDTSARPCVVEFLRP